MIRFRIRELMAEKSFNEKRRIIIEDVAVGTGINRATISRMINQFGYNTTTDAIEKLCIYFDCQVGDVAVYVKEDVK